MNILLFPTRFYPAISGGDFYLQRIGEEYQKHTFKKLLAQKTHDENNVTIFSSDAIDFGRLRGKGRKVEENHSNYRQYRNLNIKRFQCLDLNSNSEILQHTINVFIKELDISPNTIEAFCQKGPIFSDFFDYVEKIVNLRKKIFDIIHCSYLPYTNLLYALYLSKRLNIPAIVTPFLHYENQRYQNKGIFEVISHFNHVFVCTKYEKKIFIKNGVTEHNITILNMGIDLEKFEKPYIKKVEKIYSITHPTVLFCGYKNYEKGALTLLNVIPKVAETIEDVNFVFIGPPTTAFNLTLRSIKKKTE